MHFFCGNRKRLKYTSIDEPIEDNVPYGDSCCPGHNEPRTMRSRSHSSAYCSDVTGETQFKISYISPDGKTKKAKLFVEDNQLTVERCGSRTDFSYSHIRSWLSDDRSRFAIVYEADHTRNETHTFMSRHAGDIHVAMCDAIDRVLVARELGKATA